jgi:hypothetical protein
MLPSRSSPTHEESERLVSTASNREFALDILTGQQDRGDLAVIHRVAVSIDHSPVDVFSGGKPSVDEFSVGNSCGSPQEVEANSVLIDAFPDA